MRILQLSLTEVAGMPMRISRALRMIGLECKEVVYRSICFQGEIVSPTAETLARLVEEADLVHCHAMQTYLDFRDVIGDKPCLLHIHGFPDRGRGLAPEIPHVVATPDLLPEFPNSVFIPNLILPSELIPSPSIGKGPVRVFKSPSMHEKNDELISQFMAPIVKQLQGRVEFVHPKGMLLTHRDLVQVRSLCHISFDHMHGYYGLESLESLAQGLIAMNGADEFNMKAFEKKVGARAPFQLVYTPRELGVRMLTLLQQALASPLEFDALRFTGRQFVEKYYQPEKLATQWLDVYREILETGGLTPDAMRRDEG